MTPTYIGGPNETMSGEEKLIHPTAMDVQEGPLQLVDDHPGASDEEPDASEEFNKDTMFPEGNVYPLNSKKLVANQLHRLAGMLGLPSSSTGLSM